MAFIQRTSIHGRRLGLSSTRGIISASTSSTAGADQSAQMWGPFMVTDVASAGTLSNFGTNVLSSASATAVTYTMPAPVQGVRVEIISDASASAITLNTTVDTINFNSTGATSSTALTIIAPNTKGESVVLRGLSATRWQLVSKSGGVS